MNEPVIHSSTPNGSPILAYGESSAPRTKRAWFWLVIIGLVLTIFMSIAWIVVHAPLPVPNTTSILAFVSAKTPLPADSPSLWKEARRRAGRFPLFVGYVRSNDGRELPFAIVHTFTLRSSSGSWFWQLIQEESTSFTLASPRKVAASWTEYLSPAWLRVWPNHLFPSSALEDLPSFGGPLSRGQWHTDLPAPFDLKDLRHIQGQTYLRISAIPRAWPILQQLFGGFGYDLPADLLPSSVEWTATASGTKPTVAATFESAPTSTLVRIAATAGLVDRVTTKLPDGTLAVYEGYPDALLRESTTSSWETPSGEIFSLQGSTVIFGDSTHFQEAFQLPEACRTDVLAVFREESLKSILKSAGLLSTPPISTLIVHQEKSRLTICW